VMAQELDRNGVPIYAGAADYFDEWQEQAYDLFHNRSGNDNLQGSTEVALRRGIRDVAYEAARRVRTRT
jgi:hypothetical protein